MPIFTSCITRKDPTTGQMTPAEGKRRVFISYRHADEEILPLCEKLAACILEKLDVAVWYDRKLTAGEAYDDEIREAIAASDVFILLLSPRILSSGYIFNIEVPLARANHISVIPIIAGLSERDIPAVEARIGRVHMPVWFMGERTEAPDLPKEARESFFGGLQISIANKDLLDQTKLFYERGMGSVSLRYLNPEQIFLKAYGYFFGVANTGDRSVGIRLMESILRLYENDAEMAALQEQVTHELVKHLYRADLPELFLLYLKAALAKGYPLEKNMLLSLYRDGWHPEYLAEEPELSLILLKQLYRYNFGSDWDGAALARSVFREVETLTPVQPSAMPSVGELRAQGHTAYFRRCEAVDRTVELVIDGFAVEKFDVYSSFGDSSFLYLAYDPENRLLAVLYADFDHYGPETLSQCHLYRWEEGKLTTLSFTSDWMRGIRPLPYAARNAFRM